MGDASYCLADVLEYVQLFLHFFCCFWGRNPPCNLVGCVELSGGGTMQVLRLFKTFWRLFLVKKKPNILVIQNQFSS